MPISRSGLGKGLGSLIPEDFDASLLLDASDKIHRVAVVSISANPDQPRTLFDETALHELAASIKRYGVVQPLVLRSEGKGYVIIAGERRWRAAKLAGLADVPALVRTAQELEQLELALVENVQRVDLSPLEQAVSVERLHQQFNLAYSDIATRLGKASSTLNNIVRLLQLPSEAKEALAAGTITEGHARQILALKDDVERQKILLSLILKHGWSVRQAENFVSALKQGAKETKAAAERIAPETTETKKLAKRYGTSVKIRRTAKGGRVEIAFSSDEQLATLLAELGR